MAKRHLVKEFTKGIVKENPVLCLVLGTCPALAVTTSASNAIGMGLAATLVLLCSNVAISLLRRVIPKTVRIPAYITLIAAFVTVVQMLVKAFAPEIDESLGIYLPLIVVNCIILGRAEMFASKNGVLPSALDALGMGVGFTAALLLMGMLRELLGAGTLFGLQVMPSFYTPITVFVLPAGGFFVFGLLIALANRLQGGYRGRDFSCESCPLKTGCTKCETEDACRD